MKYEPTKIYFASDQHLGAPNYKESIKREKKFVNWLNKIKKDARAIYLLGDLFDFWFEYKKVVPKGYIRVLGKIAEIIDNGTPIYLFAGNHDMWMYDYLPKEIGVKIFYKPIEITLNKKKFLIGHGDGLGPGDKKYKILKKIFQNKFCRWFFAKIHPDIGIGIADYFSSKSRKINIKKDKIYLGDDKEWLICYANNKLKEKHIDYFIFGHRHIPINKIVGENSRYINTGDWISEFTYAVFDGDNIELKKFDNLE